jgi:hypothetical protein
MATLAEDGGGETPTGGALSGKGPEGPEKIPGLAAAKVACSVGGKGSEERFNLLLSSSAVTNSAQLEAGAISSVISFLVSTSHRR